MDAYSYCPCAVPIEREYRHAKKVLYLEPPRNRVATVRKKVTRIIPPPPPPPPVIIEKPPPPVVEAPPPPPALPPPVVEEVDNTIDVIAVDVDPSEKSSKSSKSSATKSSRSRSHSRRGSRDREVIIERERLVPVPVAVPVRQELETFRYVEGPRRYSPPSPPRRPSADHERINIRIEERRRSRDRGYYWR
jgi:hypothetical protein